MHKYIKQTIQGIKNDAELYFKIICELGNGTYGKNYKGLNLVNDQLVSIKVLNIEEDFKESHIQDIQTLQQLNHKNISKLIDVYFSKNNKSIWIIQEYCQFGSLQEIIQNTYLVFTESEIACIVDQVLSALKYCHDQDIIHRDLRCGSILLTKEGVVKIHDFGQSTQKIEADSFIGNIVHMSPEQVRNQRYNSKIDIWALGITIIELAEGQHPYQNCTQLKILEKIRNNTQIQLSQQSEFQDIFNDFLSKCLDVDSEKRWSAEELLQHDYLKHHRQYFDYMRSNIIDVRKSAIEKYKKQSININHGPNSQLSNFQPESTSFISDMSKINTVFQQNTLNSDMSEFMWMDGCHLKQPKSQNKSININDSQKNTQAAMTQSINQQNNFNIQVVANMNQRTYKSQKSNESNNTSMNECFMDRKSQKQKPPLHRERANSQYCIQGLSGKSGSSSGNSDKNQQQRLQKYNKNYQILNKVKFNNHIKNYMNHSGNNDQNKFEVDVSNIMTEEGLKNIHRFQQKLIEQQSMIQDYIPPIRFSQNKYSNENKVQEKKNEKEQDKKIKASQENIQKSSEIIFENKYSENYDFQDEYKFPHNVEPQENQKVIKVHKVQNDIQNSNQFRQKIQEISEKNQILLPIQEKTFDYSSRNQSQTSHFMQQPMSSEHVSSRKQSEISMRKPSDSPQFKNNGSTTLIGDSPTIFKIQQPQQYNYNQDSFNTRKGSSPDKQDKTRLFSFNAVSNSKKKNKIFDQFTPAQEKLQSHRNYFSTSPNENWIDTQFDILSGRQTESSQNSPNFRQRRHIINYQD